MRPFIVLAALGAFAGCAATESRETSNAMLIETEEAFRATIVGKTLDFDGRTFTVNGNGTISGSWGGDGLEGTWVWEDGAFCREVTIGGVDRDPDCQVWEVHGATATVTRNRGAGGSFEYSIS